MRLCSFQSFTRSLTQCDYFFLALTHGGALKTLQVTLATCPLFLRVQLNVCAPDNESNGSRMVCDAHDYLTFTTSEAYHGQQLLLHGL